MAPDLELILVNLGTPAEATPAGVRAFLREFLSDPMVVEKPRWLWLPILHGIVLRTRPRKVAEAYREIWTPAGSPLAAGTEALAGAVQAELGDRVPVLGFSKWCRQHRPICTQPAQFHPGQIL